MTFLQRVRHYETPAAAITAPMAEGDKPTDPDKGLSDNRDRYIAQSAASRNGEVAELPPAA